MTHLGISSHKANLFQYHIDDYSLHRVYDIPDKVCVRCCCLKVILATINSIVMSEKLCTEEFTKIKKYFINSIKKKKYFTTVAW